MNRAILLFSFFFITAFAANAQQKDTAIYGPKFQFKDGNVHDFGNVQTGTQVTYDFEFTNVGKQPLVITNAMASCGCTTPVWPKEPVLPGKKSKITVRFNAGAPAQFSKTVFIYSNAITGAPGIYDLHIVGTVVDTVHHPKP